MDNGAEKHQTSSDYIHTQSNADLHVDNVKEVADSYSIDRAMSEIEEKGQGKLKRTLKARHLAMIALGGVIGQGLFLSAGANLYHGGPAGALIAYAIIGFVVFWVAYSLGEMATYIPISGSFTIFCSRFVDEAFGRMIGFNYWACWSIIVAAELVALPMVMSFWTTAVPDAAWAAIWLVVIFILNLFGARGYGETEYWFSMIKVLAVVIFIIVGCFISGGVIGDEVFGFKYWANGGAFPHGVLGVIDSLVLASFSMQGTEIIGITAGECSNPVKQVPRAIQTVLYRIIVFYLGSVFVMGMVVPWDDPHNLNTSSNTATVSPFTLVFEKGTLASVAHIMNAVILITVLSCANSGLYVASRTMLALANDGVAHPILRRVTKRGAPVYAMCVSAIFSIITVALSFIPGKGKALYQVLTSLSGIAGFVTWGGICLAHYRFRKAFKVQGVSLDILPFHAPWHPFGDLFDMIACCVLSLITGYSYFIPPIDSDQIVGIVGNYAGLVICAIGYVISKWWLKAKLVPLEDIDLFTGRADDLEELKEMANQKSEITGPWYIQIWKRMLIVFT